MRTNTIHTRDYISSLPLLVHDLTYGFRGPDDVRRYLEKADAELARSVYDLHRRHHDFLGTPSLGVRERRMIGECFRLQRRYLDSLERALRLLRRSLDTRKILLAQRALTEYEAAQRYHKQIMEALLRFPSALVERFTRAS